MSPVISLPLRTNATIPSMAKPWNRQSNPRPQALRYKIYRHSHVIGSHLVLPNGQEKHEASFRAF